MHGMAMAASRGALVVKELSINESGPTYVRLVGRRAGLIAWLMSLIGVDPTTTLEISATRLELTEGSLSGKVRNMMPLAKICNIGAGFFKPVVLLLLAGILLLVTLVTAIASMTGTTGMHLLSLIAFVGSIACVVAFFLKKTLVLFALSGSGVGPIIAFKRSVIEGVSIDEEQAKSIVSILTQLVEAQTR